MLAVLEAHPAFHSLARFWSCSGVCRGAQRTGSDGSAASAGLCRTRRLSRSLSGQPRPAVAVLLSPGALCLCVPVGELACGPRWEVTAPVSPPGWRAASGRSRGSSPAAWPGCSWRLRAVCTSCPTPVSPQWPRPVCLSPPTCSPTCRDTAWSSR